jgi:hypothetical protein
MTYYTGDDSLSLYTMVDLHASNKQSYIQHAEYAEYAEYAEFANHDLISSDLCTPPAQGICKIIYAKFTHIPFTYK